MSRKDEMIAFESPFDNEMLAQLDGLNPCISAMDVMFNTFQDGMEKTNSGSSALRTLYRHSPSLGSWAVPLKAAGLFGDEAKEPTVDQVIEVGKKIKVVGPDGTVSDFSTLFLNNPTVDSLREKEKGLTKRDKHYGNVLLAYMGTFLSAKKDERFKNFSKGFKGLDPSDAEKCQVYIELPDKSRQIVTDMQTKQKRDEVFEKVEAAEEIMKSFPEEPKVPEPPVESNPFRRFFAWIGIVKHTKAYTDSMNRRNEAIRDRDSYRKARETIETEMNKAMDDPLMKKAMTQQGKVNGLFTAKSDDLNNIRMKLGEVKTLKNIAESDAAYLTKGSVSAVLDIMHNRPLVADLIRKNKASEKDAKAVEEFSKYYHIDSNEVDDTPIDDVNRLVTLVSPFKAGVHAHQAESGHKDYRNETFNKAMKEEYNKMVNDSKRAFKENFGIEPNPVNVQMVADAFNLDKYVKFGIQKIDGKVYGEEDKLPRVDDQNVGDMTFLLMSGIKTAAIMGNIIPQERQSKPAGPEIKHEHPALGTVENAQQEGVQIVP